MKESVKVYPIPKEEKLSNDFVMTVNGKNIPLHRARVSAYPILSELMLGRCHLILFKLSAYRKAYSRLLLDPVSGCKGCPVLPRKVKQSVISDWDMKKDQLTSSDAFTGDYS